MIIKAAANYDNYGCYFAIGVLNNGASLAFVSLPSGPNFIIDNGAIYLGSIRVDVNGLNGPNMIGKDFFVFWVVQNPGGSFGVVPAGNTGGSWYNSCNPGDTSTYAQGSAGCTYYALYGLPMP